MTENKVRFVYPRLQLAYLLQFAIWGSWCVALGGYLNGKMSGPHVGYLYTPKPQNPKTPKPQFYSNLM